MDMKAGRREFPVTRWSLVLRAAGEPTEASRKALDELCRAYEAPIRALARRREPNPDRLDDLVQGFFLHLLEGSRLGSAAPARGRFRSFLRKVLDNYVINAHKAEVAQKRGGQARFTEAAPDELASKSPSPEQLFNREWAQVVLNRVLARLGDEQARIGKGARFEALRERIVDDDEGGPLRDVAARLQMSEGTARVTLHRLRRRFAKLMREEVAETVARPEDVDDEIRELCASWRGEE
jgi:RNA polymerase sigma-70 factor (ECF subfamily)